MSSVYRECFCVRCSHTTHLMELLEQSYCGGCASFVWLKWSKTVAMGTHLLTSWSVALPAGIVCRDCSLEVPALCLLSIRFYTTRDNEFMQVAQSGLKSSYLAFPLSNFIYSLSMTHHKMVNKMS